MIEIDGFWWFVGALIVCGAHALHLRGWRRERREHQAWWKGYEARSQKRHEEFMRAIGSEPTTSWRLDGSRTRGQA